jgi:site-specific DNA-methyltransferase (adenine-specific)
MKEIPDKSIDLVLTDPPYGINAGGLLKKGYGKGHTGVAKRTDFGINDWDTATPPIEVFNEIMRISKIQVIFGGQYFTDKLPPRGCWIIWDKKCEEKYQNYFADCELAWTSENKAPKIVYHLWHGMIQQDMLNKETRFHPTQKPVEVMKFCIDKFSEEGQTILDPFMGSGSTLLACKELKRNYIGIEISPEYCKIAQERLDSLPTPMF